MVFHCTDTVPSESTPPGTRGILGADIVANADRLAKDALFLARSGAGYNMTSRAYRTPYEITADQPPEGTTHSLNWFAQKMRGLGLSE